MYNLITITDYAFYLITLDVRIESGWTKMVPQTPKRLHVVVGMFSKKLRNFVGFWYWGHL